MKLRVIYLQDAEVGNTWHFHVPALHIVGGGDASRELAEAHCLDAVAFTLGIDDAADEGGLVVDYAVQLIPSV